MANKCNVNLTKAYDEVEDSVGYGIYRPRNHYNQKFKRGLVRRSELSELSIF